MAKSKSDSSKIESRPHAPRISNRRAFREFEILERVEAGLVLAGTEVKSLRAGKCQLDDAYARVEKGQVSLVGADIAIYPQAIGVLQHEPKRTRKCLLHKRQFEQLVKLTGAKGMTIIPLALYFRNGYAKIELGVGRGKQDFDKRQDLKKREAARDMQREMRRRR